MTGNQLYNLICRFPQEILPGGLRAVFARILWDMESQWVGEFWFSAPETLLPHLYMKLHLPQGEVMRLQNRAPGKYFAAEGQPRPKPDQKLMEYLEQRGVTRLKLLVMSHPHADHIGSMAAVLEKLEVEQVLLPDFDKAPYPTTRLFEKVMEAIEASGAAVTTAAPGQSFPVGSGTLQVLAAGVETDNYNDLSQVLLFESGELSVVLSGDGEKPVEQAALEAGAVPRADVFKAAHHGSDTSNTLEFLQAVQPGYVAISCGLGNSYGHPHAGALERFEQVGAQVLRTDQDGSVVIAATENGLQSYTANAAKEREAA